MTHIFQVKFSLASHIRIGIDGGLYSAPEKVNIHSELILAQRAQRSVEGQV